MSSQKSIFAYTMGVVIGIDFGKKRTGLAHTDTKQIIASGLTTVETHKVLSFHRLSKETPIIKFVVGHPKQKDGHQSQVEEDILIFIGRLKKHFQQ